jgi:CheY-like chemotaxis protein
VPRILVADDNTNIQKMVTLAFQERGVEVIAVGNGEAAVRRIPDANPDLVLADVFMPVRNGYEVCEFVKKDTRFSHTPVILLVGAFDPLDEKEARRVGADGVLKKPFVPPDPLIAMVMSALEKNPRVAAELAKAKEVVAVVEAPLAAAALENPAMAEPKPLPEFPEPTPEEAAVIYGFGKGVRAMDLGDEEEEEESRSKKKTKEAAAPKAPAKNQRAPKISTGPKTQVSVPDDDEEQIAPANLNQSEDEEQFDGSATASDWRRSAADFEVPENIAADPVYSYGKNFEPITFPSERDVPPKRVRVENKADEPGVAARENVAASEAVAPAASAFVADEPKSADWEVTQQPTAAVETAPQSIAAHEVPLITASASESEAVAPAPETFFAEPEAKQPAAAEQPAAEHRESHETAARPSFVSRVRGWMDMMSPSHSESESDPEDSGDHWMNKIAEPPAEERSGSSSAAREAEAAPSVQESEPPAEIAARVEYAAEVHAETQEVSEVAPSQLEPIPAEELAATSYTVADTKTEEEPRQFGENKFVESGLGGTSYHFSDDAHSDFRHAVANDASSERHEEAQASPSPSLSAEPSQEETRRDEAPFGAAARSYSFAADPEPVTSGAADCSPDLLIAPADAARNGDLVAEHKPFEPLLVDQEHREPSDYFAAPQETQRPVAREEEAPAEASQPAHRFLPTPGEDYWNHEAAAHEESVIGATPASLFTDSAPPPEVKEYFERIPTLPPPNREALSGIPFLMPPLPSAPADSSTPTGSASADTVDEVVRKVLEKLQPQLHELLSQGVKPLVENLLQNELHKKEK